MVDVNRPNSTDVTVRNPRGAVYVKGDADTDGSLRLIPDATLETEVEFQIRVSGTWIPASTINDNITLEGGVLKLKETTTPTADAGYGKIYTKAGNELFFQDVDGNEHLIHGDAFSNIWFHAPVVDTVEISTEATFTLVDSFENVGEQDDSGNVIGSATTNDLTIGANAAGKYKITFTNSISSSSASSEMVIAAGVTLNTPMDITEATNTTPIVVTIVDHGLLNGDMATIAGCTGNTGANGDFMVSDRTADTVTLLDLTGSDSVGNGVYDASSGAVTIKFPGNIVIHREVGFGALGVGSANGDTDLAAGDKINLYVANMDSTRDLLVSIVNMETFRVGD